MSGDHFFMQCALDEAWKYQFLTYPNPAVGAAVVKDGKLLSVKAHQYAGGPHAEVLAIKEAFELLTGIEIDSDNSLDIHQIILQHHNNIFTKCSIYTTLEPCNHFGKTPSCAQLIYKLGFSKVVIGTKDPNPVASGGAKLFTNAVVGVMQKECDALIEPFLIWQKRAFTLFKLAQTHNSKITGGYLSSYESLKHVHKIREKITKLLIGGNTVAVDKPTLDCRFVSAKAPDIVIYSDKQFSRQIPLFNVANRDVKISKDLSFLQEPGFVLIEGGENMLKLLQKKIDWFLTFQVPTISNESGYSGDMKLQYLHVEKKSDDLMIYSKVKNG